MGIDDGSSMSINSFPPKEMKKQTYDKPKPQIMDYDSKTEDLFVEKACNGIRRFLSEGGGIILFDWDGTIRGNNFEKGVDNYIRRGFVEVYKFVRANGLKVGVCSLRNIEEVENLEHLGITFDEVNGADTMRTFIEDHPSRYHQDASEILSLSTDEITRIGGECIEKIRAGERPAGWEILLQAAGEMLANNPQYPNLKNLFMAHRLSEGERLFLIDDDESSGGVAEKFGIGVHIPQPVGFQGDNTTQIEH